MHIPLLVTSLEANHRCIKYASNFFLFFEKVETDENHPFLAEKVKAYLCGVEQFFCFTAQYALILLHNMY